MARNNYSYEQNEEDNEYTEKNLHELRNLYADAHYSGGSDVITKDIDQDKPRQRIPGSDVHYRLQKNGS